MENSGDAVLKVRDLQKSYRAIKAVNGVSFEVRRGEAFGLLGPNGAGKTTTIHMLAGVLRPDQGSIELQGELDPTRAATRRHYGAAPQALAVYDRLTAEENLLFFGRLYDLHGARLRERVRWALDFVGLEERRRDQVRTYSGGMKRRLNLACALIHDPPILFLDEPTVGVDPQSRNHIFDRIETLVREGRTVLYSTHYMEEAQRLCDRVAIIDHGKILALDNVDRLIDQHGGNAVVQGELEKIPGTLPDAAARIEDGTLRLETTQPFETVARWTAEGIRFRTLRVDRPDLESVFLNLTGRSLRDV